MSWGPQSLSHLYSGNSEERTETVKLSLQTQRLKIEGQLERGGEGAETGKMEYFHSLSVGSQEAGSLTAAEAPSLPGLGRCPRC